MEWKPILDWKDLPQYAGCPALMTVENKYGQLSVTEVYPGYGDGKWYAVDPRYYEYPLGLYPELPEGVKNRNTLHPAYKMIAWMPIPDAYNPYKIDVRYLIEELERLIKTPRSTIEIEKKLIPLIEDHLLYSDPQGEFYRRWRKERENE